MRKSHWILFSAATLLAVLAISAYGLAKIRSSEPHRASVGTSISKQAVISPPKPTVSSGGILALINDYRVQNSLRPLVVTPELEKSAMDKCLDMLDGGYFEHTNPKTGVRGVDLAKRAYPTATKWGENLASGQYSTSNRPVEAWINSPTHKTNILDRYRVTGIAICPDTVTPFIERYFVHHLAY